MSASGAAEVSTTAGSSADEGGSSTSAAAESSGSTTTDTDPCAASCESLDEPTCRACADCTALDGYPWQTDAAGQLCVGPSVYLGCQTGDCFGETHTWCSGSMAYDLDFYCYDELSSNLEPCEAPSDTYRTCP